MDDGSDRRTYIGGTDRADTLSSIKYSESKTALIAGPLEYQVVRNVNKMRLLLFTAIGYSEPGIMIHTFNLCLDRVYIDKKNVKPSKCPNFFGWIFFFCVIIKINHKKSYTKYVRKEIAVRKIPSKTIRSQVSSPIGVWVRLAARV